MRSLIAICLILGLASFAYADNWAVLVSGSNGFWNYRHQADVCHAYKTLLEKGLNPDHIIVLSYDDAANSSENPFPGQLFNKPSDKGVDVNAGCKIDYRGEDVTPENYLAIITGNKAAVKGGSGRVLQSTENDNVFLNFADHGATGLIAFPSSYLYADALLKAFNTMHTNKLYKKLVYYLEACESGSMFVNLPKNLNIYATSAASPDESSWGTYCSPDDKVNGKTIGSCLGDLYSVNWMEHTDSVDTTATTLQAQYLVVKKLTDKSQVMQWGSQDFTSEPVSNYVGGKPKTWGEWIASLFTSFKGMFRRYRTARSSVDSRLIKLQYLKNKHERENTTESQRAYDEEVYSMRVHDLRFTKFTQELKLKNVQANGVTDYECLRNAVQSWEKSCGKLTEYGLKYVKTLNKACTLSNSNNLKNTIASFCQRN